MKPCLKLRQRCLEMDYSIDQLAKEIGKSASYTGQIFRCKSIPDIADYYGIAKALKIPPEEWEAYSFPPKIRKKLDQKIRERKGQA